MKSKTRNQYSKTFMQSIVLPTAKTLLGYSAFLLVSYLIILVQL